MRTDETREWLIATLGQPVFSNWQGETWIAEYRGCTVELSVSSPYVNVRVYYLGTTHILKRSQFEHPRTFSVYQCAKGALISCISQAKQKHENPDGYSYDSDDFDDWPPN